MSYVTGLDCISTNTASLQILVVGEFTFTIHKNALCCPISDEACAGRIPLFIL
jgi:hypothetical protein